MILSVVRRVVHVYLFVMHAWPEADLDVGDESGRIISARKATALERRAYEEEQF